MAEIIERWKADAHPRGMTEASIYTYGQHLATFQDSLSRSIAKAGKMEIRTWVDEQRQKGLTTKTIKVRLNALSNFYEFLIFEGVRKDNPVPEVQKRYLSQYKAASEAHTHKLISVEDAARLVASIVDIRDKAMLLLMFKTGVRRGELLSMDVSDIQWENQSITLKPKKKRSNKIVFFDDETEYVLKRWLEIRQARNPLSDALWISTWGKRIGYGSIQYNINRAAVLCGLHDPSSDRMEDHFSAHCTRHWMTTHLLRSGMERSYVQWLRGDAIREAVDIYYHIDPDDVRRSYLAHVPRLGV